MPSADLIITWKTDNIVGKERQGNDGHELVQLKKKKKSFEF